MQTRGGWRQQNSSMQIVCPVLCKVKGHIKDGTRRKRLPGPENFCWVYDVRNKGGKRKRKYIEVIGRPTEASKKSMAKSAACLHWFVCCCFLLFNVSQWRCLLFIEFVVLESAFLLMMILHISSKDIHLIEMLFKEDMFPIKGPGPFQQACQRPIGHSSNQVSQILANKRRATLVWEHPFTVNKARLIQRHYWKFDEWICISMLFQKSDFSALLFFWSI